MRNIIIAILLLTAFTGQSQTKWRQIERSLTKWNVPAAYDSIPGQAGYAGKWIALTALLDSLGIDSIGGGSGGGIEGIGSANKVAYWKTADSLSFNNNFHWDNSNVRLGIGLTSPNYTLHTNGAIGTNNDFFLINPSYSNSGLRIQNYPGNIAGYGVGVIKGTNASVWANANDGLLFRNDIKRMVAQSDFLVTENFGTGKAWLGASDIAGVADVVIVDASPGSAEVTAMKYASTGYPPLHLRGHEINLHTNATPNWPTFSTVNSADIAATIKGDKKIGLSTTSPTRTLDINGELRIRDLATDNPTLILGADSDGDVASITLGTGLTLAGTSLSVMTSIDSTIVTDGYGINVTESPANTFTVSADTAQLVTPYDLSLVDQSSTNEIQTIDTFQVFDTNKLRISLSNDGQAAKVVTLPTSGGGIDSTIVAGGWGIDVTESPLNTFTVKTDTAEVATQYDLTLKQDKLVSGTNIKTVNSNSLLGSGNVSVGTVTSIATSAPISGGTITGSGTIGLNYDSNTLTLSGSNLIARNGSAIWNSDKLQNTNIKSVLSPSIGNVLTYTSLNQWEAQAPSAGTTNLTFSGASSPFTLNSDTGSDVTIAAGTGISLTRSTNELTIASTLTAPQTWGDFTTNIQSWGSTGSFGSGKDVGIGGQPTRDFDVIGDSRMRGAIYNSSNSAGSSGQVLTSNGTSAWTWATPADGSATNELQTISTSGAAGNITLSNGGGTLTLNVNDADASATNEAQTLSLGSNGAVNLTAVSGSGGGSYNMPSHTYGFVYATANITGNTLDATKRTLTYDASLGNNTTQNTGSGTITINTTGTYRIEYNGAYKADAGNYDVWFEVFKNGSDIGYVGQCRTKENDNDTINYSKSFIADLTANDVISVTYYRPGGPAGVTISFYSVNLIVQRIN